MTTKLTTQEMVDSVMLMAMVSGPRAERGKILEKIITSKENPDSPDSPAYEVSVKINGIEVDFRDFVTAVNCQLDEMVTRAAGQIVNEQIQERVRAIGEAMHDIEQRAKDLALAVENEARAAWGRSLQEED
jgi:hypothetical protein